MAYDETVYDLPEPPNSLVGCAFFAWLGVTLSLGTILEVVMIWSAIKWIVHEVPC